ncbi:hypothetical protein F5B19DRAFT_437462 [Rostrohypoxylon terebratum]|nr:hypothetical protein F5B19DRAFT_437462 [Rostrohypoxylon terebratum]
MATQDVNQELQEQEQEHEHEQDRPNRPDSPILSFSSAPWNQTPPTNSPLDAVIDQLLKEQSRQGETSCNPYNREHRDFNLMQRVSIDCQSGDTLIIVNFPQGYVDCRREPWSSKQFHAHSENLLGTNSKVFARLLSPSEQARVRKRIGETFPQKYVLDLTPSVEGDELAAQLIELSLPPGVRDWWISKERLDISQYLVSGHDDHCPDHKEVPTECQKTSQHVDRNMQQNEALPRVDLAHIKIPQSRMIVDYCPIRHRANIIRLILAIQGHDLVLNSASRVYTLTGIANILDCTSAIRDLVCTWLMEESNNAFIDINTEAAFKMAWTLKLANVTRAAFRILVVEKALDALSTEPRANTSQYTIFGRSRIDLPDDMQTVVQYAALKLVDRVNQTLARLKSDDLYNLLNISEYQKLVRTGALIGNLLESMSSQAPDYAETKELFDSYTALFNKLLEYKNWLVREAMETPPSNDMQRDYDRDRRCYVPNTSWVPTSVIYDKFSEAQHLLTPNFWIVLAACTFSYTRPSYPDNYLEDVVDMFNCLIDKFYSILLPVGEPERSGSAFGISQFRKQLSSDELGAEDFAFDVSQFRDQLDKGLENLWMIWTKPDLEAPLNRTRHMVLALSDEEIQYLPLWAGGLDDGTGGVFEPAVPDADLGPIGPGPAYRTGMTVATDSSSICQSEKTPSQASTVILTAGRSIAAAPSNAVLTTVNDSTSAGGTDIMSTSSVVMVDTPDELDDETDDAFDFDEGDEISEEAWSQVEEP